MTYLWAFVVGGLICVAGQLLIDLTSITPARVLVTYVVAGVGLSALGLYDPLAEFAGAGASVPLLGFGHLLAQGVVDAVEKSGLLGALCGGFSAAAAGVTASLVCGVRPTTTTQTKTRPAGRTAARRAPKTRQLLKSGAPRGEPLFCCVLLRTGR